MHSLATQHLFEQRLYVISHLHGSHCVGLDRARQWHSPRLGVIRRHIQSSADITVGASEAGLSFFRQEPVDVDFRRIGIRRPVKQRDVSIGWTDIGSLFKFLGFYDCDRRPLFRPVDGDEVRATDKHRITALTDRIDLLRVVS